MLITTPLPHRYMAATSDPYIVFSIDPPARPGCKILRHGGYFGRTVRTDMQAITPNCPSHPIIAPLTE